MRVVRRSDDAQRVSSTAAWIVLGILLPLAIGAAFGHPTRRVIVPESVMLTVTVALTLLGGLVPGMVAAVSSTLSLWFFSFPPGLSFRATDSRDVVAALAAGGVACGLVALITVFERRQRAAIESESR